MKLDLIYIVTQPFPVEHLYYFFLTVIPLDSSLSDTGNGWEKEEAVTEENSTGAKRMKQCKWVRNKEIQAV